LPSKKGTRKYCK